MPPPSQNLTHYPDLENQNFYFLFYLNSVYHQQMLTIANRLLINHIMPKNYTVCYCQASNARS
jgi:hypothetical protein